MSSMSCWLQPTLDLVDPTIDILLSELSSIHDNDPSSTDQLETHGFTSLCNVMVQSHSSSKLDCKPRQMCLSPKPSQRPKLL